jgi:2-polyprenyl-6-methoxyphenol hydroxylase-like FAD-dependent oxidoreductase
VTIRRHGADAEAVIDADLVVDAGGRGSLTPRWLEALGYERPAESLVEVDIKYASRFFRRQGDLPGGHKALYIVGKPPGDKRLGILLPVEGDRWMALVAGVLGDHPPTDPAGYLAFARGLPVPDLHEAIKDLEPLGDIAGYKFPASRRRHYEQLRRLPEGLVVVGDALCSFNPIYGQGITTAALEALALDESLRERPKGDIHGLAKRYFARAGKATDLAWMMTTGEDFRYPEVKGDRPFYLPALEWYMNHVHRASAKDPEVFRAFVRAMHMVDSPFALFDPRIAARVLRAGRPAVKSEGPLQSCRRPAM